MQTKTLIFLGGLHRSGTSLLFKILKEHPQISGFSNTGVPEDEGQLLQSIYPPAKVYGGPGRFGFNKESFLDENSSLASSDNAEKLFQQWCQYWDLSAPFLLEKSPPNLVRSRFLQALFPNSRFIMILRHPVAVAYATYKWSRTSISSLLEHWLLCHERFIEDSAHIKNLYILKYEDFIATPDKWLERIYDLYDLENVVSDIPVKTNINDRYFKVWQAVRVNRASEVQKQVDKFETRIRNFGYSLEDLNLATPLEITLSQNHDK